MKEEEPKVRVEEALKKLGSQAEICRTLGLSRSSVNEWVVSGREFVPDLQAYRLSWHRPDLFPPDLIGGGGKTANTEL